MASDFGVIPTKHNLRRVTLNNLFQYSTKELTTDAFLAWLFVGFDTEAKLKGKGADFFCELGLGILSSEAVTCITISRQEKKTDLMLRCEVDGDKREYLFENKTYTTIHSNQLKKYKSSFPKSTEYIYLKLGLINYEESESAKNEEYKVVGVEKLYEALLPLGGCHFLIDHYIEFIENEYIAQQNHIKLNLISDNKFKVLNTSNVNKGQEQQFFLSSLHQELDTPKFKASGVFKYLKFRYSANKGGFPWVQLTIAKRNKAYGHKGESIFWRIDKRRKNLYLRLTQYSDIEERSKGQKYLNRNTLREEVSRLPSLVYFTEGKVIDHGTKSSEIIIFFFEENNIEQMLKHLPELSSEIVKVYDLITWV